jgi:hypothetical protein
MSGSEGSRERIFISYRRDDSAYPAGWLFDRLTEKFGAGQVFKDVDSIKPGEDFGQVIDEAVGSCDVLLAVIGRRWLEATDENGVRRLDKPGDLVRLEIEAAPHRFNEDTARLVEALEGLLDEASEWQVEITQRTFKRLVFRLRSESAEHLVSVHVRRTGDEIDVDGELLPQTRFDAAALEFGQIRLTISVQERPYVLRVLQRAVEPLVGQAALGWLRHVGRFAVAVDDVVIYQE